MKHLVPEFEELRERFPAGFEASLVLPCLRRIQEDRGYVAESDIEELAVFLGVPQIQIEEVLSFYTQFRRKPIGRWHLQFCHNVSCSMNGAENVLAHVERTRLLVHVLDLAPLDGSDPEGNFAGTEAELAATSIRTDADAYDTRVREEADRYSATIRETADAARASIDAEIEAVHHREADQQNAKKRPPKQP